MKTTIWGNILPAVTIDLEQGESIYTESGGMTWMSDKVKMDTCLLYTSDAADE